MHLGVREFWIVEGVDGVLECQVRSKLVVESLKNAVQDANQVPETFMGSVASYALCTSGWEGTLERFCMPSMGRVIESGSSEDVSWFQTGTRLFGGLNNTIPGGVQWHVHLHDLACVPCQSCPRNTNKRGLPWSRRKVLRY